MDLKAYYLRIRHTYMRMLLIAIIYEIIKKDCFLKIILKMPKG